MWYILKGKRAQYAMPKITVGRYKRKSSVKASRDIVLQNWMPGCLYLKARVGGFPGGAVVESLPANAGDTGSSPGLGRSHMPRSN